MMSNAQTNSSSYALTSVATTGSQKSSFSHNSGQIDPSLELDDLTPSGLLLDKHAYIVSNDSKSKNRVVQFGKLAEFKINRDATRPSLFSRGGDTQAQAIFDHHSNPHPFECAQGRRWEGSNDWKDHIMFDFQDHSKSKISSSQALENSKKLFIDVYGLKSFEDLEKQGGFFSEHVRAPGVPLARRSPNSVKIGTDCSGLEAPLIALNNLCVPYEHTFSCDNDPHVQKTIFANHQPSRMYPDIVNRDNAATPYVDVYVAGFPCQPFSVAGKQQGFDDSKGRGHIFYHVLGYISAQLPKVFILENVKGLVKMENGKHLRKILKLLRQVTNSNGDQAYEIHHAILDTKEHGVPHSRPRWYCVGIRKDAARTSFEFPEPVSCPSIDSFLDDDSNKEIVHKGPDVNKTMLRNIESAQSRILKSGGSLSDPYILDCDAGTNNVTCTRDYSPCITRSRNRGHWLLHKNRRMNISEMMRLQGINPAKFKVDVSEGILGQQIGNAMSVNVIERILNRSLQAAGLTRKGCLKGHPDVTSDRWANGKGFQQIRSPCREISELNVPSHSNRQGFALAVSLRKNDRQFILDTGASFHLIGEHDLSPFELDRVYKFEEPFSLLTGNGVTWVDKGISIKIKRLGIEVECVILKDVPAVLSLGKLVRDEGFRFTWEGRDLACLSRNSVRVYCPVDNNVPFIEQSASALVVCKSDGNSKEPKSVSLTGATHVDQYSVDCPPSKADTQGNQQAASSLTGDAPIPHAEADSVSDPGGNQALRPPAVKAKAKPRGKAKAKTLICSETSESEGPPVPIGPGDSDAYVSTRLNSAVEGSESGKSAEPFRKTPKSCLAKKLVKTRNRKKAKHASCVTCEHNIFTHFPKDPNCEICIASKPTRGQCRTTGPVRVDALPPPKEWLDAVTLDHKIISEADKSADGHRAACVVCDRATYWIQGYPAEHKNEADTVSALVEFAGPQGRAKHIYSDNSKEINAACTTLGWPRDPCLPHRPQTNGIAENAVKKVSEGTSCCMVQSRFSDEWWHYAMRCYCFLRNVVDKLWHGKTAWEARFGQEFKHIRMPFGCEIIYLPRSEAEKSKLHAFGDKWLQGIFLGYVQQKGGGFANQLLVIDWDDLNNAISVGKAMQLVKQCHHEEVLPVLYNGKHRFPLAEGDLDQPGITSSITRKIKLKKAKIAEAVEIKEKELQEADAKRRKELGIPDDPSSANADFWTCNQDFITCHHRTPRSSLFIPTDSNCPFPLKWIDVTRFTQTSLDSESMSKIDDLWNDGKSVVENDLNEE